MFLVPKSGTWVDGHDLPLYVRFIHLVENVLKMFQVVLKERDVVMASL